jgi:glutamate-1-semialdehyde aminotransferase
VDPENILEALASLPVSTWSYKAEPGVRHLGPTAQDFYAAFGLGQDDRHISTIDAEGVTMAAVQALYRHVQEQDERIRSLERENARLLARIEHLEESLATSEKCGK